MGRKAQTWDDVGPTVARFLWDQGSVTRGHIGWFDVRHFSTRGGSSSKPYPLVN